MVRNSLIQLLKTAVKILVEKNGFSADVEDLVEVEPPKQAEHGDFATNFCLVASKKLGQNPRALAEMLVEAIREADQNQLITEIDIAGPGFINFKLSATQVATHIGTVLEKAEDFGKLKNDSPERINVEFVSVNPNGPITIGSGRGAAFGSALCKVLEAAGNTVHREYYINDGVNSEQMRLFAESVKALCLGLEVPENGYKGDYVITVAEKLKILLGDSDQLSRIVFGAEQGVSTMFELLPDTEVWTAEMRIAYERLARYFKTFSEYKRVLHGFDGDVMATIEAAPLEYIQKICEYEMVRQQSDQLHAFNLRFDTWFSEQSLHDSGEVKREFDHLLTSKVADAKPYRTKIEMAKGGVIKDVLSEEQPVDEDDAAGNEPTVWLRSTKFGDDQDRVLRRKDGRLTYIASDVAYHKNKFNRPNKLNPVGFKNTDWDEPYESPADKLITVLGPDHHGYIGRLTAVVAAMHADQAEPINNPEPLSEIEAKLYSSVEERNRCQASLAWSKEHLQVQIFQIVRFLREGKPAPMRKRDGTLYTLIDLVNEIGETIRPNGTEAEKQQAGSDVARFFYLMRHHDTAMDFDLELATKQSDENPVFYVQYAHARISSVIEKAKEQGFDAPARLNNPGLLNHPKEIALILKICDLPHEVERTAKDYSVNRLTTYAIELARTYHSFYDSCRVIQSDQPELTLARLALCQATRIALKNALNLLGVSAPERMDRTVAN